MPGALRVDRTAQRGEDRGHGLGLVEDQTVVAGGVQLEPGVVAEALGRARVL
jgi:hypothetical protein